MRSHHQSGQIDDNYPSAIGQALPSPSSAQRHAEAKVCARDGIPTTNRILFIAALSRRVSAQMSAIAIAALCSTHAAGAVELKVLSGGAMRAALQELARTFENASGRYCCKSP